MAIIRITIFISKVYFYVFVIICKILLCMTSTTQVAFIIVMIIYIFILFSNIFTFFFFLFHIIMPLLVTKCVFKIFFITMSIKYHDHENINQMLLHSLMGMEQNQLDMFHDFLSKPHCFVQPYKGMK